MRPIQPIFTAGLVVACALSGTVAQAADEERIELSNFDFTPRDIHLHAGQATVLVLSNTASGGHNFAAREFFAAARVDRADAAMIEDGKIEVPAKSTRTVHLVPAAGTYKLTCSHTLHTTFGMKGTIVVE